MKILLKISVVLITFILLFNSYSSVYAASTISEIKDVKGVYKFFKDKGEVTAAKLKYDWNATADDIKRIIGYIENEKYMKQILSYKETWEEMQESNREEPTPFSRRVVELAASEKETSVIQGKKEDVLDSYDKYYKLYYQLKSAQKQFGKLEDKEDENKDKSKEDLKKEIKEIATTEKADELIAGYGGFEAFIKNLESKGFTSDEINEMFDHLELVYASGDTKSDYGQKLKDFKEKREELRI